MKATTTAQANPAPFRLAALVLITLLLAGSLAFVTAPAAAGSEPFRDVPPKSYYAPAVEWGYRHGITTGTTSDRFDPANDVTRAELVTFLWRAAGRPKAGAARVSDVPHGRWYSEAVSWAVDAKITTLVGGTNRFEPHRTATRAEAVTFLWRAMGSPRAPHTGFKDVSNVAWAIDAISWAQDEAVTTGVGGSQRFEPNRNVSRADALVFIWRAVDPGKTGSIGQSGLLGSLLRSILPKPKPKPKPAPAPAPAPTTPPAPPSTTPTTSPAPSAPAGWQLYWSDEFNSSALQPAWRAYHNTYGDGNNELACLTPNNLDLSGGSLKIRPRKERVTCPHGKTRDFTSGFIGTRETGTYFPMFGRFEMRARLPHAQGLWPAFWLRHRNGSSTAEVDVMEYFHARTPGRTSGTLHLDGKVNSTKKWVEFEAPTASPGWHTWAIEIEPVANGVKFTFLFDGSVYHSYVDTKHAWADGVNRSATWDIAVNLAVGGRWVGHPSDPLGYLRDLDQCAQGGTAPNGCSSTGIRRATFTEAYEIDYVRVYTR